MVTSAFHFYSKMSETNVGKPSQEVAIRPQTGEKPLPKRQQASPDQGYLHRQIGRAGKRKIAFCSQELKGKFPSVKPGPILAWGTNHYFEMGSILRSPS